MNAIVGKKIWACLLALLALGICSAARANEVVLGSDYFQTVAGTYAVIPPFGVVDFKGLPFGPGLTDTIIERTSNIGLNNTPTSPNLLMEGLSLVSTNLTSPIYVALDPSNLANDTGMIMIDGSNSGGTFSSVLDVFFDICTAPGVDGVGCGTGSLLGTGNFTLSSSGNPWSPTPPPGAVIVSGPVGDQAADLHTNLSVDQVDFFPAGAFSENGPTEGHVVKVAMTPEPGTLLLLGAGLLGLGGAARPRRKRS